MKTGFITGLGNVRKENQDRHLVLTRKDKDGQYIFLGMVADGMGGTGKGSIASSLIQFRLQDWWEKSLANLLLQDNAYDYISSSLDCMIELCNKDIISQAELLNVSTGTTLSLVFGYKNKVIIKHIGDTRIFVCRGGCWEQVTKDHSWEQQELDMGRDPKADKDYARKCSALTNALGVNKQFHIDTKRIVLEKDDAYFICSDGFYHYINPNTDFRKNFMENPQEELREMERVILRTPASDNYTGVLLINDNEYIEIEKLQAKNVTTLVL